MTVGEKDVTPNQQDDILTLPAPATDPLRQYLKEVARVPLLSATEEVDLAMRIEAGGWATALIPRPDPPGKEDRRDFRRLVHAVVRIRERQLDPARCLRREGIGQEGVTKSYRPKDNDEKTAFLHRVQGDAAVARNKLVEANLRLVVAIAKRYATPAMPLLDLTQEGNLGLIHAVEKYDYARGFKFSTYATWWIRQSIVRAIGSQARTIRVPAHVWEQMGVLYRTRRHLTQQMGREPVPEELSRETGLSTVKIEETLQASRDPLSLEMPLGDDAHSHVLGDVLADPAASEAFDQAGSALTDRLREVLQSLLPREQRVMRLRFGLLDGRPRTLEETGREFGLTRERIRQIEGKALSKLRHPSRRGPLREYLE